MFFYKSAKELPLMSADDLSAYISDISEYIETLDKEFESSRGDTRPMADKMTARTRQKLAQKVLQEKTSEARRKQSASAAQGATNNWRELSNLVSTDPRAADLVRNLKAHYCPKADPVTA